MLFSKDTISGLLGRGSPDDTDTLLERGVAVRIGGLATQPAETVFIKEPVMEVVEAQILEAVEMFENLGEAEKAKIDAVKEDEGIAVIRDLARLKPIQDLIEKLLGQVVGKDAEYVRKEMSVKQITRVGTLYVRAIGFEEIRELFLAAKAQLMKPPKEPEIAPTPDRSAAQ